jgi:hypothetical protein
MLRASCQCEATRYMCVLEFCGFDLWTTFDCFVMGLADTHSLGAVCEHFTFQERDDYFDILLCMLDLADMLFAFGSRVEGMFQPLSFASGSGLNCCLYLRRLDASLLDRVSHCTRFLLRR